jgi:general secretion pathway protein J
VLVVAWTRGNRDGADQWLRWQSEPVRSLQAWQSAWNFAALWAQSPSQNAKRQEVAIAPLAQWQIYFYRGGAWSNPLSSTGAAEPAGATGPLPTATNATSVPDGVRLVLTVPTPHPLAGVLTRDWARPTLTGGAP